MMHPHLQHHRHSSCLRHPSKPITGFCASCLRERLAGFDPDTHRETPLTHLAAELRRSKSHSSSKNPITASSSSSVSQPRRKSCDVRPRSTLSDLFHTDDRRPYSVSRNLKDSNLSIALKEEEEIGAEIRVSEEVTAPIADDFEEDGELKTMKEFIDLESGGKKNAGSFWEVASVFRKKLVKWQLKQKSSRKEKKSSGLVGAGHGDLVLDIKKSISRLRETRPEIEEFRLGRRSCDVDPRLSVDMARLSVDDPRYSFDEPRASWDGCLMGKTYPPINPLDSVEEDANPTANGIFGDDPSSPGGTKQTRDYYSERRRRKSTDRFGSNGRLTLGDDDFKSMANSNAKVSPETVGLFHVPKLLVTEKELRDSNWYSLKDYTLEGTNGHSKDTDSAAVSKKGYKWRNVWNFWATMQKKREVKCGDNSGSKADSGSQKLNRSYTVSARDSRGRANENGVNRKEELVLQRNRSSRYSPDNLDNGLLKFYLTPLKNTGRSKSGKSRLQNSHSAARNVL